MAGGFSITISAIDSTTATLDKINAKLEKMKKSVGQPTAFTRMQATIENTTRSLRKFADVSGITKFGTAIASVTSKFSSMLGVVGKLAGPIGAIIGGSVIAMAWKAVTAWASYGRAVLMTAGYIGAATDRVQRWAQASQIMGMQSGALAQNIQSLSDTFEASVMNPGGQQGQLLRMAGINPQGKGQFQARNASDEDLAKISTFVRGQVSSNAWNESSARQYMSNLGISPEMQMAMMRGGDYLTNAMAKAKQSAIQTNEQLTAEEQENQKLGVLNNNIEQTTLKIGALASMAVNPLIDAFNNLTDPTLTGFGAALNALALTMAGMAVVNAAKTAASVAGGGIGAAARAIGAGVAATGAAGAGVLAAGAGIGGAISFLGGQKGGTEMGAAAQAGLTPGPLNEFNVPIGYYDPQGKFYTNEEAAAYARKVNTPPIIHQGNMQDPRGIRNNNPGNLSWMPGQGASGSDGRFGVYKTMEEGIAANVNQMGVNQDQHGINTIRGMIGRWAPPGENNTEAYIQSVAKSLGVSPDQPVNFHDPKVAAATMQAISQVENGRKLSQAAVEKGVAVSGMPVAQRLAALGSATQPASGKATLDINLNNFPPGTTTTASTYGDLLGRPNVSTNGLSTL